MFTKKSPILLGKKKTKWREGVKNHQFWPKLSVAKLDNYKKQTFFL